MIVVKLTGGLGNQLFQYALGRKLALEFNTELALDVTSYEDDKLRKYSLEPFSFAKRLATGRELSLLGLKKDNNFIEGVFSRIARKLIKPVVVNERQFNFDPQVLEVAKKNMYLNGYWQTERYFSEIRPVLLEDIIIREPLLGKNLEVADRIRSVNSVSLHIRRGDYVSDRKTSDIHGICDMEYYYRAIAHISEKVKDPVLFIFSDDMQWVKANFQTGLNVFYVEHNSADMAHEDLRLITLCKHNIIANSSFSWWGAWLNRNPGKLIISPKRWFKVNDHDTSDVYPDDFIKL